MKSKTAQLEEILNQFKPIKVLVVGDLMLDRYLSGTVSRISPEAPVPILNFGQSSHRAGGAANVAMNLIGLGAKVNLVSVIGTDQDGDDLIQILDNAGLSTNDIIQDAGRQTTTKTRIMADSQHLLRVDREQKEELSPDLDDKLLATITHCLDSGEYDALIFQDYDKGTLNGRTIPLIMDNCKKADVSIYVDPKFEHFYDYQGADLFKPNLTELRAKVPFAVHINERDLYKATDYLRRKLQCRQILVTLSDAGIFIDNGTMQAHLPAISMPITDVCGAGDTVISVATLCNEIGLPSKELAYWSSLAGTITCQYPGVRPITAQMLLKAAQKS